MGRLHDRVSALAARREERGGVMKSVTARRAEWPNGPWSHEPNSKRWASFGGLACLIQRHQTLGHLCGYVALPTDHPLIDKGSDEFYQFEVHGGVTWNNSFEDEVSPYWVGFDCAHSGDLLPGMKSSIWSHDWYRDIDYVTAQCELLSKQILDVGLREVDHD